MLPNKNSADSVNTNFNWQYDSIAKFFHWVLAVLLIGMLILGWYMVSLGNQPGSHWYFDLHKSFGLLVAVLIVFRLIWRLLRKPGSLPPTVPEWQAKTSRFIHWLLYLCMICMPLTGFFGSSFGTHSLKFFGLALPNWIRKNPQLSEKFFTMHGYIAWVFAILISLHLLAALKHLLINKDNVFRRMWF